MSKEIIFNEEARKITKERFRYFTDIESKALRGPKGRNVLLQKQHGTPHITKDGVSVERNRIRRYIRGYGCTTCKRGITENRRYCSDGTTMLTVLAQKMAEVGFQRVNDGANPVGLKRGIDTAWLETL